MPALLKQPSHQLLPSTLIQDSAKQKPKKVVVVMISAHHITFSRRAEIAIEAINLKVGEEDKRFFSQRISQGFRRDQMAKVQLQGREVTSHHQGEQKWQNFSEETPPNIGFFGSPVVLGGCQGRQ